MRPDLTRISVLCELLRRYARAGYLRLFCRPPVDLKARGAGSWIARPRSIVGRRFISIGANTHVLGYASIEAIASYAGQTFTPSIEIGSGVYIGQHVFISAVSGVQIGDGCVLSEQVYITDCAHGYDPKGGPIMRQPLSSKGPVVIGESSFIGYRAVISAGVSLGRHCVVGAQSVVTRSFPAYSMIAGAPAKLIKRFVPELNGWVEVERAGGASSQTM